MNPMLPIIQLMSSLGEIEWGRAPGTLGPPPRPPYFVWRFKERNPDLEWGIANAIRDYRGAVEWSFIETARKCLLIPTAFLRFGQATGLADGVDQIAFGERHPEQALAMLADIPHLAAHIRRELGSK